MNTVAENMLGQCGRSAAMTVPILNKADTEQDK